MSTTEEQAAAAPAQEEKAPVVPLSFGVTAYWKRARGDSGITRLDFKRLSLPEVLNMLLESLADDEATLTSDGMVSTIVIDWSKVPEQISNPFKFGVRR